MSVGTNQANNTATGEPVSDSLETDSSVPWQSNPLDELVGYKLRRAQLVTFKQFHKQFRTIDLRPADFAVMMVLESHPGLKQAEVAAMLEIKRANFVALMDRLEERGLAERRLSGSDRRSYALFLTESGKKAAQQADKISKKFEAALVKRLGGEAERHKLMSLLARLLDIG